jgi:hypothetical protein
MVVSLACLAADAAAIAPMMRVSNTIRPIATSQPKKAAPRLNPWIDLGGGVGELLGISVSAVVLNHVTSPQ